MSGDAQATPPAQRPSVFLSYASEDRSAARALRDTLAAAGLEVWLDEDELGGGEAWDTKIRNQIRTCTYFMPLISATTEVRREGYFRREWRLAVERTLDFADDVLFLVPIVIDDTRDAGARVPEKFFAVQWLRVPGGQATPALRELAQKLATGDTHAAPVAPLAPPTPGKARKSWRTAEPPPPFPKFPAFPEPGHRSRFIYELVLWFGHLIHSLWGHLPRFVRIIAAIFIIFNLIAWVFRNGDSAASANKAKQAEVLNDVTKALGSAGKPGSTRAHKAGGTLASMIGAAVEAAQAGRPLAMVTFSGTGPGAEAYADEVFENISSLLPPGPQVGLSPIPLTAEATDTDCLERGLRLKSKHVLTGFVHAAAGQPPVLTARLYDVQKRAFRWTENYDSTTIDAPTAAQRIAAEVKERTAPANKEP